MRWNMSASTYIIFSYIVGLSTGAIISFVTMYIWSKEDEEQ